MARQRLSPLRKAAFLAGIGGSLWAGGVALERHSGTERSDNADLMEFVGKLGIVAAGVRAGQAFAARQMLRNYQSQKERSEGIKANLPKLAMGLPVNALYHTLDFRLNAALARDYREPEALTVMEIMAKLSSTRRTVELGVLDDEPLAYEMFAVDIEDVIQTFADARIRRRIDRKHYETVCGQTLETAHFLDEFVPIADDCPNTPQTSDNGKYWFDYIDHRAQQLMQQAA